MVLISRNLFESILKSILESRFPEIEQLSDEQSNALFGVLNRQDVFAILPTGHGKSIIFQLLVDFCKELYLRGFPYPRNAIVLVICPLNSLVDSHIRELDSRGLTASSLTGDIDESKILRGHYSYLFASPESVLQNDKWRKMLQSEIYQRNVFAVVTDEAHVVPKWGFSSQKRKSSKKEYVAAFRECFSRLGELRSLLSQKPLVPVLALTATANLKTRKDIRESLCLRKECIEIFLSPNRENIYVNIVKVNSNIGTSFKWLIKEMRERNVSMDKTIVYCKSIKDCGRLFMHFKQELGQDGYPPDCETLPHNLIFAMYHHSTLAKNQKRTLESFHDENGKCRLVFATNALGMGVNFPNIRRIVHYGPPREMEELVQQIGRGGRDGKPAVAVIMYNGRHLKNCDQSVKDLCRSTSGCLRKLLLADFGIEEFPNYQTHECCVNCHIECSCLGGSCSIPLPQVSQPESKSGTAQRIRNITEQQEQLLRELLKDNVLELSSGLINFLGVDGTALFTDILVKKVLKHTKYIFTKAYILENLPVFKNQHAMDILCMVNDVFEDIDEQEIDISQCSSTDMEYTCSDVELYLCEELIHESSESEADCTDEEL